MDIDTQVLGIKPPATEKTLQSIDESLKRIEAILYLVGKNLRVLPDVRVPSEQMSKENSTD